MIRIPYQPIGPASILQTVREFLSTPRSGSLAPDKDAVSQIDPRAGLQKDDPRLLPLSLLASEGSPCRVAKGAVAPL
jgi:hypothetical protein